MAAQHLLCQTRPALVRVGLPLPFGRRAWRPGSISCCRWRSWRCAHAGSMASRWLFRSPSSLCRRPHGLSAADWRRPLRVRPLDFYWPLLAVPAAEGIALLGSNFSRPAKVPASPALDGQGGTYTIALFLPVLFYANAIQGSCYSRGRNTRAQTGVAHAEMRKTRAGCWPRPGCLCSSPSPTICAASL